jgi:hypothetical protein
MHDFCKFANEEDHGFIEVTEWTNQGGYDVVLEGKTKKKN